MPSARSSIAPPPAPAAPAKIVPQETPDAIDAASITAVGCSKRLSQQAGRCHPDCSFGLRRHESPHVARARHASVARGQASRTMSTDSAERRTGRCQTPRCLPSGSSTNAAKWERPSLLEPGPPLSLPPAARPTAWNARTSASLQALHVMAPTSLEDGGAWLCVSPIRPGRARAWRPRRLTSRLRRD